MKKNLKKIFNFITTIDRKILLIGLAIIVALIVLIVIVANSTKVSESDRKVINDASDTIMNYMYVVADSDKDDIGKYIAYATLYIYNEEEKTSITSEEVISVVNKVFNKTINEDDIAKVGISKEMFENNIVYEPTTKAFTINNTKTPQDIAQTTIYKYVISSIKKKSNKKFVVIYDKYSINDPYRVLNFYSNADIKFDDEGIKKYLNGKGYIKDILTLVDENNASSVGKKESRLKVTYEFVNGNLKVNSYTAIK